MANKPRSRSDAYRFGLWRLARDASAYPGAVLSASKAGAFGPGFLWPVETQCILIRLGRIRPLAQERKDDEEHRRSVQCRCRDFRKRP